MMFRAMQTHDITDLTIIGGGPTGLFAQFYAGMRGATSQIVDALPAGLNRQAASEIENRFAQRLDRMSMALGRIERDGHILLESLALFVRYELMVQAPLPEGDEAARAVGHDRFEAFVARVGDALAMGKRTLGAPASGEATRP